MIEFNNYQYNFASKYVVQMKFVDTSNSKVLNEENILNSDEFRPVYLC